MFYLATIHRGCLKPKVWETRAWEYASDHFPQLLPSAWGCALLALLTRPVHTCPRRCNSLDAPVFSPLKEAPLTWTPTGILHAPAWGYLTHNWLPFRIQVLKGEGKGPGHMPCPMTSATRVSQVLIGVLGRRLNEWHRHFCQPQPQQLG